MSTPPLARSRPTPKGAPDLAIDDPNSPVFADDGTMYVTGSENPAIFRVAPGGEHHRWTTAVGGYPNGITLTPDGTAVVVAQSHPTTPRAAGCGASRLNPMVRRERRS